MMMGVVLERTTQRSGVKMRTTVLRVGRFLLPLTILVLALTLLTTPASAAVEFPSEQPALVSVANQAATEDAQPGEDTTTASSEIQQDLVSLSRVQSSAQARLDLAKKEARRVAAKLERSKKDVAKARQVVGAYLRSMYINGATELTMMASILDTDDLGDLVKRTDDLTRVGDHKDDQFDRAVQLLRRTEAAKAASDASLDAAKDSLAAIDDQVNGLRQRRADVAGKLAGQIRSSGSIMDADQAERNSAAAVAWADYLGQLAKLRVPPVTARQLSKGKLPKGLTKNKKQPGVAVFRKGKQRVVVLPERTIAAVTYAVSKLGSDYRWKANTATEMDCSALVDRSWNVPALPEEDRKKDRALVAGGVRGLAREAHLIPTNDRRIGDVLFLSDAGAGVNHAGIAVTNDVMITSSAATGSVNALAISTKRVWRAGRMILPAPKRANDVPKVTKKAFQCGADPDSLISLPDGKTLGNAKSCPPATGVFSEANMQPSAILAARCAAHTWPQIQSIGGFRPHDAYPDHPSGRAIDLMIPGGCSMDAAGVRLGNVIAEFFMQNADKFNVEYMLWRGRMWYGGRDSQRAPQDWGAVGDRGGCTANHMDHLHITFRGPNENPSQGSSDQDD